MSRSIRSITVDMKPVGKGRPRFTRLGHTYTPDATRIAEQQIKSAWITKYGDFKPFQGPIAVSIGISDLLPKSMPKKVAKSPYTVKPDIDNVAKLVLDSLNGIAFEDDSQVTVLNVNKHDRNRECTPGIHVKITRRA